MIGIQRLSKIVHHHVKCCATLQHISQTHHLASAESTPNSQLLMSRSLKCCPTRMQQICQTHHLSSTNKTSDAEHLTLNPRIKSHTERMRDRIVEKVSELGIKPSVIRRALSDNPELARFPLLKWKICVQQLLENGVVVSKVVPMIEQCPELLTHHSEMMLSWTCWSTVLKSNDKVSDLVQTHPHYLLYSKKKILQQMGFLSIYFPSKVIDVLLNCPDMFDHDIKEVQKVLLYVTNTMNIKKESEIYKSSVLNHSLKEVMARHVFLQRCGKFTPPNPKHDVSIPTGNPTLSMIYDTPVKEFATLVAGLTVEEFIVFQEVYEMELADETDSYSDSDSESD